MSHHMLENITGFDTTYNAASELHHFGHFGRDLSGVSTPEACLALAQELGRSAARDEPGTWVRTRGNGDLMVYVDTPLSRRHSHVAGIFMVVRSRGSYGLLATMFAPDSGSAYFERADRMLL